MGTAVLGNRCNQLHGSLESSRNMVEAGLARPGDTWLTIGGIMDTTTLLIIILVILLIGGGGWYGRGRWF